jgi:hypothetical protein
MFIKIFFVGVGMVVFVKKKWFVLLFVVPNLYFFIRIQMFFCECRDEARGKSLARAVHFVRLFLNPSW